MPSIREEIQPSGAELGFIRALKADGGWGGVLDKREERSGTKRVAGIDGHASKVVEEAKVMGAGVDGTSGTSE